MKKNLIFILCLITFPLLNKGAFSQDIPPMGVPLKRSTIIAGMTPKTRSERIDFAQRWYPGCHGDDLGKKVWQGLESISPSYLSLVGDIGIVQRLDEFKDFAKKENDQYKQDLKIKKIHQFSADLFTGDTPDLKPWKENVLDPNLMRDQFSQKLGHIHLYRGVALTESECQSIQQKGMNSGLVNKFGNNFDQYDVKGSWFNVQNTLRGRLHGNAPIDYFMSMTARPRVAEEVAKRYATQKDKKVYIYKLRMPLLDVIHPLPAKAYPKSPFAINSCILYHQDTESMAPFIIEKDEILGIMDQKELDQLPAFDPEKDIVGHPDL